MKKHYLALWALLAVAFAIFAIASAFDMPAIGSHQLKSSGIADALLAQNSAEQSIDGPAAAADSTPAAAPALPAPLDTASQTILFIGDSMLEGLGPRMAAYAEKNGHTLYTVIWYSSTSEVWGQSDKLAGYMASIKPTYVFICLGANELFVSDIAAKRRGFVRKIIADVDTVPYVWIGPPNWKPDTGINNLIAANTAEGTFFVSNGMHFDRSKDGAHPTRTSAALWLDSVARWMPEHCAHPIRMEAPDKASAKARRIFVHQPNER